jgi:hypothetical protein
MARDEAVDALKALYSGLAAQMEPGSGTPPGLCLDYAVATRSHI